VRQAKASQEEKKLGQQKNTRRGEYEKAGRMGSERNTFGWSQKKSLIVKLKKNVREEKKKKHRFLISNRRYDGHDWSKKKKGGAPQSSHQEKKRRRLRKERGGGKFEKKRPGKSFFNLCGYVNLRKERTEHLGLAKERRRKKKKS